MTRRPYRLKPPNPLRKRRGVSSLAGGLIWVALAPIPAMASVSSGATLDSFWPVPCLVDIAKQTRLSPTLLQAIVFVESRGHPWALNINTKNGPRSVVPRTEAEAKRIIRALMATSANFDIGLAQINSRHLRDLRIQPEALLDPCLNLLVAGTILNRLIQRYGESWTAIMRYNGNNPAYAWRVRSAWQIFLAAAIRQSK